MDVDPLRLSVPVERDGVLDRVAIEEPLEIRVRGEALAVTMRTPGQPSRWSARMRKTIVAAYQRHGRSSGRSSHNGSFPSGAGRSLRVSTSPTNMAATHDDATPARASHHLRRRPISVVA